MCIPFMPFLERGFTALVFALARHCLFSLLQIYLIWSWALPSLSLFNYYCPSTVLLPLSKLPALIAPALNSIYTLQLQLSNIQPDFILLIQKSYWSPTEHSAHALVVQWQVLQKFLSLKKGKRKGREAEGEGEGKKNEVVLQERTMPCPISSLGVILKIYTYSVLPGRAVLTYSYATERKQTKTYETVLPSFATYSNVLMLCKNLCCLKRSTWGGHVAYWFGHTEDVYIMECPGFESVLLSQFYFHINAHSEKYQVTTETGHTYQGSTNGLWYGGGVAQNAFPAPRFLTWFSPKFAGIWAVNQQMEDLSLINKIFRTLTCGAATVTQQDRPLLATPTSHTDTGLNYNCFTFNLVPC